MGITVVWAYRQETVGGTEGRAHQETRTAGMGTTGRSGNQTGTSVFKRGSACRLFHRESVYGNVTRLWSI